MVSRRPNDISVNKRYKWTVLSSTLLEIVNTSGALIDSKALHDSDGLTEKNISHSEPKKTTEPIIEKSYDVVESMATFTMVGVLKSQKHFHQALAVLEILKLKGRNDERISTEKADIQQLIKDSIK